MADSFGIKLGVEGEKEFKSALSDINLSFKVLGSEMRLVQSQFGKNYSFVESLTSRNEVLNRQIEKQKEKIATLKSALDNASSSFGENDRQTHNWQIQLNNAEDKLRVAAYCRVSTATDAQLESLETQKNHYENYINSRDDWCFAGVYYDEGITGTKASKRPELMRLLADCKARKIDFVITKSISRFARNTLDCLKYIRMLKDKNIPVFFEKESINPLEQPRL